MRCPSTCCPSTDPPSATSSATTPTKEAMLQAFADTGAFNDKLVAEGYFVFADGLEQATTATVVDGQGDQPVFTDGPYLEAKEHLGGFWVIEAPDLDVALRLAARGVEGLPRQGRGAAVPHRGVHQGDARGVTGRRGQASRRRSPGPTAGVGPGGRRPDAAVRGPRHRRGRRRRGVRDRRRALAARRRAAQPRRVAHHHGHPQGHRPPAPGVAPRREAPGGPDARSTTALPSRWARSTTTGSGWSSPAATRRSRPTPGSR